MVIRKEAVHMRSAEKLFRKILKIFLQKHKKSTTQQNEFIVGWYLVALSKRRCLKLDFLYPSSAKYLKFKAFS